MSVAVLLVTHADLGQAVLRQADVLVDGYALRTALLEIQPDDEPQNRIEDGQKLIADLDDGDGVLILTDLYGATPSNIAHGLIEAGRTSVVHGLNLGMLMRAHNYADVGLAEMVEKVIEAGHRSIFAGDPA
ncbi:MAG: PTS fructose IIA subunit family protein [Xanthomonadales bacterium]|nr:PTS fructose IIA subunit family protein [Xanthomonadales bacterium]